MSKCHVVKVKHNDYPFMVITEQENPMLYLERISFELYKHGVKNKKILFDNLLHTGDNENRFSELLFDGKEFVEDSFKQLNIAKKNPIRLATVSFLRTNRISLNESVLTAMEKMKINKGISI